ncbi:programmed cell death 6-interacting -like [Brachionus plicatilis]|uniref:Programmed cell death 6-interacting-like n=1 Tax=Brachionus plicatilis TaxID=10195 RepID=A0A3M7PV89_BRAPC|nr:programmed cell death 6-interacting -like [Brachionus plicatilis]
MGENLRDRYLECKNLIEQGDFKKFVEQYSIFIQQSNDEEYQRILINNLVEKLKDECKNLKLNAAAIKKFEPDIISSLNENFTKIKSAFEICEDLNKPNDDFNEQKALIEKEISEIVKKKFYSFIESKKNLLNSTEFDENFRKSINSLIGMNVFDEINNQVIGILSDLSVDDQLPKNITDSILQKGMNDVLKASKDDVPPQNCEKLKKKASPTFHINQTPNADLSIVLKELGITENDQFHHRTIDSVLSEGVNSFSEPSWIFKKDMKEIYNDFDIQELKKKLMESFYQEFVLLRQATEQLNAALITWDLPAAIEDAAAKSDIPQLIIKKSQMIKQKGGIARIDSIAAELPPLLQRNTEILNETKRSLEEEETFDNELRSQMRGNWNRTASAQLTKHLHSEIRQYEGIIQSAIKSNKLIEEKYNKNRDGIELLSKSVHEIRSSLPVETPMVVLRYTNIIKDMRKLMDEVEALRNVREVLESELKCMDSDELTAKLISALSNSQGLDEHSVIQAELVGPMKKLVRKNIQEQEKLLRNIESAINEFSRIEVHNESKKMREKMMKNLTKASDIYNELFTNLVEGVKFYNDLTPILIKFQSKVDDFVFARKTESEDLMKEIQT